MTASDDAFYVVDFDRTLADTDRMFEVFLQVADEYITIPRHQIEAAAADVKRRGDSFDTAGYVRNYLIGQGRLDDWDRLTHRYVCESQSLDMLLPGAAELLGALRSQPLKYGILTYGNPLWQRLKLSAVQLQRIPHIVMTTKDKGRLIGGWQGQDGFSLPSRLGGGTAERIVLIDDKAASFEAFPGVPSWGYWVLPEGPELPSQQGRVPGNVSRVSSLYEVARRLNL